MAFRHSFHMKKCFERQKEKQSFVLAILLTLVTLATTFANTPASSTSQALNFQTDLFTGRFAYQMPIAVPPGRQGSQPNIGIGYSSAGGNGWCGEGWGLDMGFIERDTSKGSCRAWSGTARLNSYDDTKGFVVAFQGVNARLINISGTEYRAEVDSGACLKFVYLNPGWEVTDKSGTKYVFGDTSATRIENPNWAAGLGSSTFHWALSSVKDVNGNQTTYTYSKDRNQLYLSRISYNANVNAPVLAATHVVDFALEALDRPDMEVSYRADFPITTAKRLKSITPSASASMARRYDLAYATNARNGRSMLTGVTQFGADGVSALPPTTFAYQDTVPVTYPLIYTAPNSMPASQSAWSVREAYSPPIIKMIVIIPTPLPPYSGDSWSSPVTITGSQSLSRISVSVDAQGAMSASGVPGSKMWALTWVYVSTPRTINLSLSPGSSPDCLWREDSVHGVQQFAGDNVSIPLEAGWSIIHYTCQNLQDPWSGSLTSAIKSQVDIMSPNQVPLPVTAQLSADVNGDGRADLINFDPAAGNWTVALSTGTGFQSPTTWLTGFGANAAAVMGDWNSDGKTDIGAYSGGNWTFATSTGTSFQTGSIPGINFGTGTPLSGDFNGDGWGDLALYQDGAWKFAMANRTTAGWTYNPAFDLTWGSSGHDPLTGDFNGDGITDLGIVPKSSGNTGILAGTGSGWETVAWSIPEPAPGVSHSTVDLNEDGASDLAYYDRSAGVIRYLPSTGMGFGTLQTAPVAFSLRSSSDNFQFADFNGDGLGDLAVFGATGAAEVTGSVGKLPNQLSVLANGLGGSAFIQYKPSTLYDNLGTNGLSMLPFPVSTVSSVTVNDGLGNSSTVQYNYKSGMFCTKTREFHGFNYVEEIDPLGAKTVSYFHQGGGVDGTAKGEYLDANSKAKKGIPYRVEVYGSDGLRYTATINKVEELTLHPNGWYFPYVSQSLEVTNEGLGNYRAVAKLYQYDSATLNLIKESNLGEINNINAATQTFSDVPGDSIYSFTTFATLANANIKNKPSSIKVTSDSAGTIRLRETQFVYNSDQRGSLQKKLIWVNPNGFTQVEAYSYDGYGNPTSVTDAAGITTTTTYDATYKMFPATQTVGSNFVTQLTYGFRSGNLVTSVDPKGLVTTTTYDNFFRPTQVAISTTANGTASLWREKFIYGLGGIVGGKSFNYTRHQVYDGVDLTNGLETFSYTDGLGRVIQTRSETEIAGQYRIVDVFFDVRGNVQVETVPILSAGSAFTVDVGQPGTVTQYDAIGRPSRVTPPAGDTGSPSGVSIVEYKYGTNPWATSTTDPTGKRNVSIHDAYGRTVQVGEVMVPGVIQYTYYTYDLLGNLVQVKDVANNLTTIAYDSLGRKTQMVDPDMGTWNYTYDLAGRMLTQTDPKNQKIVFSYNDSIGRLTQKDIYNSASVKIGSVSFVYDTSDDPSYTVFKGQLYKMTDREGWQKNGYDFRGRLLKTGRYLTKNGATYVTENGYNDADRQTTLTYPGALAKLQYSYDSGGNLKKVESLSGTGAAEVFYTAQGFNAMGQITGITYGNSLQTTLGYYPNSKRPKSIQTSNNAGGYCQGLTFTYDASANLASISDSVYTGTASGTISSIQYDKMQRMVSITSVAQGTKAFSYDGIGNTQTNLEYGVGAYVYGATKPHAVLSANGKTYNYDSCGNMTARGGQVLAYNEENQLASVTSSGSSVTFGYDGNGGRLWRNSSAGLVVQIGNIYEENNGKKLCHVRAEDRLVATFEPITGVASLMQGIPGMTFVMKSLEKVTTWPLDDGRAPMTIALVPLVAILGIWNLGRRLGAGSTSGLRIHGPGVLSQLTGVLLVVGIFCATTPRVDAGVPVYGPVFYYYHGDFLGSSSVITDRDGDLVQHYEYSGYGKEKYKANTLAFPVSVRYSGQILDEGTGLYYYGARYYDPELGRFIQPDTIAPSLDNPQSLNRYTYCGNNPINNIDPSGHSFWKKVGSFFKQAAGIIISLAFTFMGMPFIGAFVSSAVSTALNGGSLADFGIGLAIGFAAGFAGGYGAGKIGAFFHLDKAGLGMAMLRGGLSGAIGGAGAAAIYGGNVGMGALMGAAVGAGMGGVVWAKNNYVTNKFLSKVQWAKGVTAADKATLTKAIREYGQSPVGQRNISRYLNSKLPFTLGSTPYVQSGGNNVAHAEGTRMDIHVKEIQEHNWVVKNRPGFQDRPIIQTDVVFSHEFSHMTGVTGDSNAAGYTGNHPLNVAYYENTYRWWIGEPRAQWYGNKNEGGLHVPFKQGVYQY